MYLNLNLNLNVFFAQHFIRNPHCFHNFYDVVLTFAIHSVGKCGKDGKEMIQSALRTRPVGPFLTV